MEERLENKIIERMEAKLMEIAGSMQKTLEDLLQQNIHNSFKKLPENEANSDNNSTAGRMAKGNQPHYSCGTRLARIDFPRFNGENVNQRIYQCETYFTIDNTPEDVKVRLAIIHLEGKTLHWHTTLAKTMAADSLLSWTEYTQRLIDRFGAICEDPMADLIKLR